MLPNLPLFLPLIFILTVFLTLLLCNFYITSSAAIETKKLAMVILGIQLLWLIVQGTLALNGVYSDHLAAIPPKLFLFGLLPPLLIIVYLFLSKNGRSFMDTLPLKQLTLLNIVRIPVEIGLFVLYVNGTVPKLMTFEGGNLDILSGLSAFLLFFLGFRKRRDYKLILLWNVVCLGLLLNIMVRALLSAPFPLQKLAFDQPNVAILHFPFIWLPTFIVPLVLFGHLVSIRKLLTLVKS